MRLAIVGTGYVGLVSGVCFAEMGNRVVCVDVDKEKIERLNKGESTIYEPGLEGLLKDNLKRGNISFTDDLQSALQNVEIVFIAVGTPQAEDGSADLSYVKKAAEGIANYLNHPIIIATKSTVPVGTAEMVRGIIRDKLRERGIEIEFDVVSNPEFLKEGDAVNDFMRPDRVIVGADNERSIAVLKQLYAPFTRSHERFIAMDTKSAEITKYAANSMLATKISFMNEIANLCELFGADVNKVRIGIGSDRRIGYHFIYPGCGFGGSCFPKDLRALHKSALDVGYRPVILEAVQAVNEAQKHKLGKKVVERFGTVEGMTFALWGLSFKPETDDMREAPSITLIKDLISAGAKIIAYDPKAMHQAASFWLKGIKAISYADTKYEALKGADALIIVTEWKEFRSPDFWEIKGLLKNPIIFDGRNLYDRLLVKQMGLEYHQIGVGDKR
jgi:UDPglucose 6-dehydrogenase